MQYSVLLQSVSPLRSVFTECTAVAAHCWHSHALALAHSIASTVCRRHSWRAKFAYNTNGAADHWQEAEAGGVHHWGPLQDPWRRLQARHESGQMLTMHCPKRVPDILNIFTGESIQLDHSRIVIWQTNFCLICVLAACACCCSRLCSRLQKCNNTLVS